MCHSLLIFAIVIAVGYGTESSNRIINGQDAVQGGNPNIVWQVYFVAGSAGCGGSIIGSQWILTAAHCVRQLSSGSQTTTAASQMSVTVGLSANAGGSDKYFVESFWVHPSYTSNKAAKDRVDMAVLKLKTSIDLSNTARVNEIPMAAAGCSNCKVAGTQYVVSGYGNTVSTATGNSNPSSSLKWAPQEYVETTTCQSTTPFTLPVSSFCTGAPAANPGTDSCSGDSGGPLASKLGGSTWTLIGVVQSGSVVSSDNKPLCGSAAEYGIYTDVAAERTFIDSVLAGTAGPPSDNSQSSSDALCFHSSSLISYKGSDYMSLSQVQAGAVSECLIPHTVVSDGVAIVTSCHEEPLRLTGAHLVFSKTHGLIEASKISSGDIVFGDVTQTKECIVSHTYKEYQQTYMGLNCRESVVIANGIKCSTFESIHTLPSIWMKYVPSVLGMERASKWGEFFSIIGRRIGVF